jgi:hypothetical protein
MCLPCDHDRTANGRDRSQEFKSIYMENESNLYQGVRSSYLSRLSTRAIIEPEKIEAPARIAGPAKKW